MSELTPETDQHFAESLSSVPVVGCRNGWQSSRGANIESIKRSGGGVSERTGNAVIIDAGVYQAFRWWGVGTGHQGLRLDGVSLSSVPVVGCRNPASPLKSCPLESIKRSGGGVSEQSIDMRFKGFQSIKRSGGGVSEPSYTTGVLIH